LSEQQIEDWKRYYISKPFGHWINSQQLAMLASAWAKDVSIDDLLPKVELIREKTEDEQIVSSPGFGGAEEFLRSLQRGDHQKPIDPSER